MREYVCMLHACRLAGRREEDPPELGVQVVVNHQEGAQKQTGVPCKEQELPTFGPSIQPRQRAFDL